MYNIKTKDSDYFIIVTTHECGRRCPFCIDKYRGRKEYISLDNVEKALDYAETLKVKDIFLTGGEPTKHPDIVEIAKRVKKRNFNLVMTTNYENPDVMKQLDGIVDSFNVSYYDQKELPDQKDYKSDITLSTIIWQERFLTQKDLDDFIDKFEKKYYLKFSTLNSANNWCVKRKFVDYLDNLPNAEYVRVFEFYPAQIYRGHVIMRADLPHIENNVRPWKMFPNGEISDSWTRIEDKIKEGEKKN